MSSTDKFDHILKAVPQQPPFRYLDSIDEMDENHIVARYTFKKDEYFYQGHFPGNPVTPGVILIEAMAQTSVVAFGLYLLSLENPDSINSFLTMFTDVEAEFLAQVSPGDTVTIKGEKQFFRRLKLRSKAELYLPDGKLAASATLSGLGVSKP